MLDVLSLDAVERNAPDHTAADALGKVESKVAIRQALATLSMEEEVVVRRLYGIGLERMDAYELSNEYLIPRSTVYARHKTALRKLRKVLEQGA